MPGMPSSGPLEVQPVLAAGHLGPGEDDDVENLREDQCGDGKIDVAQPGREIGHERRHRGGGDQPEGQRQHQVRRRHRQQRRGRAVHAEPEERRVPERHHAGVADQDVGRHREQTPDQNLGAEPAPERRQHQGRNDQQRHDDAEPGPVDDGVALAHLGVGTNRPVGRNSNVRIRTTKDTITACDGFTQIEA